MLDDDLKDHRKRLEEAINGALTHSPEIEAAIEEIRQAGYEVFLIIEATIGFNRTEEAVTTPRKSPTVHLELTTQDEKFLRMLKISPD